MDSHVKELTRNRESLAYLRQSEAKHFDYTCDQNLEDQLQIIDKKTQIFSKYNTHINPKYLYKSHYSPNEQEVQLLQCISDTVKKLSRYKLKHYEIDKIALEKDRRQVMFQLKKKNLSQIQKIQQKKFTATHMVDDSEFIKQKSLKNIIEPIFNKNTQDNQKQYYPLDSEIQSENLLSLDLKSVANYEQNRIQKALANSLQRKMKLDQFMDIKKNVFEVVADNVKNKISSQSPQTFPSQKQESIKIKLIQSDRRIEEIAENTSRSVSESLISDKEVIQVVHKKPPLQIKPKQRLTGDQKKIEYNKKIMMKTQQNYKDNILYEKNNQDTHMSMINTTGSFLPSLIPRDQSTNHTFNDKKEIKRILKALDKNQLPLTTLHKQTQKIKIKKKKRKTISEAKLYGGILLADVRSSLNNLTRSQKQIPIGLESILRKTSKGQNSKIKVYGIQGEKDLFRQHRSLQQ